MSAFLVPEPGPTTLKTRPWAGERLARLRNASGAIGESWEFSTLPGSESRALGQPLSNVLGAPLPWLAKLIDTARPLSVQVHPDDDAQGRMPGKEEAWIVLDAAPGAHVFAGLRPGVSREQFVHALERAHAQPTASDALFEILQRIDVRPGSVVLVPARTIHAICGGILLAEIQQPSDCTYRFFDYGSDRQLHVEQALAALDPEAQAEVWQPGQPDRQLNGKHVHLQILTESTAVTHGSTPQLIVAVAGLARLRAQAKTTAFEKRLARGDLALATSLPYEIELHESGLVVSGWVT